MRRREFIAGLGGAAVWPIMAREQQQVPLVSYLQFGQAQGDLNDGLTQGGLAGLCRCSAGPQHGSGTRGGDRTNTAQARRHFR
jgi:hypothetical protein